MCVSHLYSQKAVREGNKQHMPYESYEYSFITSLQRVILAYKYSYVVIYNTNRLACSKTLLTRAVLHTLPKKPTTLRWRGGLQRGGQLRLEVVSICLQFHPRHLLGGKLLLHAVQCLPSFRSLKPLYVRQPVFQRCMLQPQSVALGTHGLHLLGWGKVGQR